MSELPRRTTVLAFSFLVLAAAHAFVLSNALTPDGLALLDFKNGLVNTTVASSVMVNWDAGDASPCHWSGVTCSGGGFVRAVNLSSQGLEGQISPSLGSLRWLEELYLSSNNLHGSIPSELGNCTSLITLYLDGNSLSGQIPASLGNLTALSDVNLNTNKLTGEIPASFAACPSLTYFDVGTNMLTGSVPRVIYSNLNLIGLYVNDNNLTGDITAGASFKPTSFLAWLEYHPINVFITFCQSHAAWPG